MQNILVVEDDGAIRETLKLLLESEGYMVFTASSPQEAQLNLDNKKIDLVITDINMNGDGLVLIAAMAARAEHAGIPVIAMTAASKYKDKEYSEQLPYLVMKPFTIEEMLNMVREKIEEQHAKNSSHSKSG